MKREVDKYHALQRAALTITSELSLQRVLQKIVDTARELAQARYAALGVVEEGRKGLAQFIVSGLTAEQIAAIGPWPRGLGLLGTLLQDPRPLRVREIGKDRRSIGVPPTHPAMTSFLGVPIISKGTILGNFYLTNKIGDEEFSADDEELIMGLAAFAAVTIDNARLYAETDAELKRRLVALERADQHARFLLELSAHLPTGPLAEELPLEEVLKRGCAELGDACAAYIVGPDGQVDRKVIVHRDRARAFAADAAVAELWDTISDHVLKKERAFYVADVDAPAPLPGFAVKEMKARGFTAGFGIPIKSSRRVFGVFLSMASKPLKLSEDDFLFGQLVAARLGTALENAALLRELKASVRARDDSIAELRQAEQGLAHLAALVESSDDSIVSWTLDGIIASWNPSAERLYGYSAQEAIGKPIATLFPADRPGELPGIVERLKQGQPVEVFETVRLRRDGRRIPVSVRVSPIKDKSGRVIGASSITRDISELKRAEEALRESEEEYRATFEQAAVGVAHVGLDGHYLLVNQQLSAITGYSATELTAMTAQDITYPADRAADAKLTSRLLAGEIPTYSIEQRCVRKDGVLVWINLTASLLRQPSGKPQHFVNVVEDIDQRKESEQALRKLSAAVEQSPIVVMITDTVARIDYVNPRFTELTGYTAAEVLGKNPRFLKSGNTSAEEYRRLWDTISSGGMWRGHFLNKKKSGELYWESASISPITTPEGTITHYVAVKQDITERKAADAERERLLTAVQQQATELDTIITSISNMVLIYDPAGKIVRLNAAAQRMLGYSASERDLSLAERATLLELKTAEGRPVPPAETPGARALRGETVNGFVMRLERKGHGHWVIAGAGPLYTSDGKLFGAVVTLSDITALHELQEQHREYVALVSHDLRTPLAGMLGQADLLRQRMEKQGLTQEAQIAAAVVKSARRMNTMIQELVDSASLEAGQLGLSKKLTDLTQLVRDVVDRMVSPEERARVTVEAPAAMPPVEVDAERIERVITNLLSNALKYSPSDSPVVARLAPQGDRLVLSVTDRGVGISAEDIPHLFQRFYRAKTAQRHEGLGLGLYISRLIAEAHGGVVWVESEVGRGSTFHLALPIADRSS